MIKIARVQTRPSTNVPFFSPREDKAAYTITNFISTNKLTINNSVSEDGLVRTGIWTWVDQISLDEYNSNELVQIVKQDETTYMQVNSISLVEHIENI